jgi:hypothetical protein
MDRDRRLTGWLRGQVDRPIAPAGFEYSNGWRVRGYFSNRDLASWRTGRLTHIYTGREELALEHATNTANSVRPSPSSSSVSSFPALNHAINAASSQIPILFLHTTIACTA